MMADFQTDHPQTGDRYVVEYICERNHPTVDFSKDRVRHVDLRLSRDWTLGRGSDWRVTSPPALAGEGRSFPAKTGSIGGSEEIRWRTSGGAKYLATISISDIVGDYGPDTLWLAMGRVGTKGAALTCGPVSMHHISKGAQQ